VKNYLKAELKTQLFDFCNQMLHTKDYDPNYFAVKGFCENVGLTEKEMFEFCFIFNGFYHFGGAAAFLKDPTLDVSKMKYGKSRRGFMGNKKVLNFIQGGKELKKYIYTFKDQGFSGWTNIYNALLKIPGCGHWSAYYLCDMFHVVLGFNISAPNLGFLSSESENRGPMSGLRFLTGIPEEKLRAEPELHGLIYNEVCEGVPFEGMQQFESLLCNFLSLHKSTYYVGRDIDRQMAMMEGLGLEWWSARSKYFPKSTLGEVNGWSGIRKELMGTFEPGRIWE
jgi:hypothetical protein